MDGITNRLKRQVSRGAVLGGGVLFGYVYLEEYITPFFPLAIVILASLIAAALIRLIFVYALNKRLLSEYRYSSNTRSGNTANQERTNTGSKYRWTENARSSNTKNQEYTNTGSAHNSSTTDNERINTPPDTLQLYRNLLGLGPRFTANELKAAYRNCAAMYHPDRYASATRKERETAEDLMKRVNEAYECLKSAAV